VRRIERKQKEQAQRFKRKLRKWSYRSTRNNLPSSTWYSPKNSDSTLPIYQCGSSNAHLIRGNSARFKQIFNAWRSGVWLIKLYSDSTVSQLRQISNFCGITARFQPYCEEFGIGHFLSTRRRRNTFGQAW
jgi:hypothetical protein